MKQMHKLPLTPLVGLEGDGELWLTPGRDLDPVRWSFALEQRQQHSGSITGPMRTLLMVRRRMCKHCEGNPVFHFLSYLLTPWL